MSRALTRRKPWIFSSQLLDHEIYQQGNKGSNLEIRFSGPAFEELLSRLYREFPRIRAFLNLRLNRGIDDKTLHKKQCTLQTRN